MFGKKNALLLEEAEAKIAQLKEKVDWHERHYDKQQGYIEELYDIIALLTRQLGMVLESENLERLLQHRNLQDNSNFFMDLSRLFFSKFRKGRNIACYFGSERDELERKFQERDFKNSKIVYLTERLTLGNLNKILKDGLWTRTLEDSLQEIRNERKLDKT